MLLVFTCAAPTQRGELETSCPLALYWLSALASTFVVLKELAEPAEPAPGNAALEVAWVPKGAVPVPAALTAPVAV